MIPIRPLFFNIPHWAQVVLYISGAVSTVIFLLGMWRRAALWRRGRPYRFVGEWGERLARLVTFGPPGQRRVWERVYPGLFHAGMLWAGIVLFLGTVLATLDADIGFLLFDIRILRGWFYLGFELVLDLFGLLFVAGLIGAIYRRYVQRPGHISARWGFVLWSLLIINATGFILEGLRLGLQNPSWAAWSPVGYAVSRLLVVLGLTGAAGAQAHLAVWLVHMLAALVFVASIPYNNAVHLLTSSANVLLSRLAGQGPAGAALTLVEIRTGGSLGVAPISDFTWKQRLGLDACTRCGRCTTVCPAHAAGARLDPKEVIVKLDEHMRVAPKRNGRPVTSAIYGDVVSAEELWACTTCLACVRACPVFVEIVDDIVDLRRYLVDHGQVPVTAARSLEDVLTLGSAWAQSAVERARWSEELGLRAARPGDEVPLLYWVGDTAPYDVEAQEIPRAIVQVLKRARLDPMTLGMEDGSDGEAARRLGEEGLFQTVARRNIERLQEVSPGRILTHCPHTFNTFRNEYPQLGGRLPVVHHSQLLLELIRDGRIRPTWKLPRRVTYHDPCYLGRYNSVYDAPREVLRSLPGLELVEMEHARDTAFCCGGGGGLMWLDMESERRVNNLRFEEAERLKVDLIVTACPYCKIMLREAAAYKGSSVQVKDLAEVVLEARP